LFICPDLDGHRAPKNRALTLRDPENFKVPKPKYEATVLCSHRSIGYPNSTNQKPADMFHEPYYRYRYHWQFYDMFAASGRICIRTVEGASCKTAATGLCALAREPHDVLDTFAMASLVCSRMRHCVLCFVRECIFFECQFLFPGAIPWKAMEALPQMQFNTTSSEIPSRDKEAHKRQKTP
jgi:hypothetical protein